ncbi:3-hydroxybutyrate dehydrogenase [uncultured Nisaea sp.]|uniref:3-hydroxybutyrate dehydrogenase n=1 Tax=uncultured Nisaea sp. TaxID=538215 RepID=UPI0030EED3FB|tara:strand:+ start:11965 stop:12747 length:783 start_codon:yes stop_codon:yes gene_type:complete
MLNGKCALVTGSVSGLGYAVAEALARAGAHVVLNGLCEPAEGHAAAARLSEASSIDSIFDPADLSDHKAVERMIGEARDRFGSVDIVVNNAVVRHFSSIEDFELPEWEKSLSVNLTAPFLLAHLTLPAMKQRGWGRIINMSSVYGWRGAADRIDYVTTKTALIGMTRAIAIEAARTGITCNAVCPGSVPTPAILERIRKIAQDQGRPVEEVQREYAAERNPTGRFVAMEHVGDLVTFLCSPAGDDITGASMPMDGGWLAS